MCRGRQRGMPRQCSSAARTSACQSCRRLRRWSCCRCGAIPMSAAILASRHANLAGTDVLRAAAIANNGKDTEMPPSNEGRSVHQGRGTLRIAWHRQRVGRGLKAPWNIAESLVRDDRSGMRLLGRRRASCKADARQSECGKANARRDRHGTASRACHVPVRTRVPRRLRRAAWPARPTPACGRWRPCCRPWCGAARLGRCARPCIGGKALA